MDQKYSSMPLFNIVVPICVLLIFLVCCVSGVAIGNEIKGKSEDLDGKEILLVLMSNTKSIAFTGDHLSVLPLTVSCGKYDIAQLDERVQIGIDGGGVLTVENEVKGEGLHLDSVYSSGLINGNTGRIIVFINLTSDVAGKAVFDDKRDGKLMKFLSTEIGSQSVFTFQGNIMSECDRTLDLLFPKIRKVDSPPNQDAVTR